jgi:hypothetical protein
LQEGHDWLASAESSVYFAFKLAIYELIVVHLMDGELMDRACFSLVAL